MMESNYRLALEEANKIIKVQKNNTEALYYKAESHYHLCQVVISLHLTIL